MEAGEKKSCLFMGEYRPHGASAFDGANMLECMDGRWEIQDSDYELPTTFGP